MGRHLYIKIYLAFLGISALCIVAAGMLVHTFHDRGPVPQHFHEVAEVFVESLPETSAEAERILRERTERLGLVGALFDDQRRVLMSAGEVPPPRAREDDHWVHRAGGPFLAIHLRDGRWLVTATAREARPGVLRFLLLLLPLAGLAALCTYPLARGVTRRVENLRRGVEELGAGDLSARVEVCGKDEVAVLARSFNRAADRIEALVDGQRRMLAGASHELRSPLARLRLSVELLHETEVGADRDLHLAEAVRNIEELDRLIEDLLLAGRLEVLDAPLREPVELLALAAEEGARVDAEASGAETVVAGDEALLRILLRNLLENGARHGAPPIRVQVTPDGDLARVVVSDAGPGVSEGERERIFEAFQRPDGEPEESRQGAGLGLSLVRRVATIHGGSVRCETGDGGRFVVELPRVPESD